MMKQLHADYHGQLMLSSSVIQYANNTNLTSDACNTDNTDMASVTVVKCEPISPEEGGGL